MRLRLLPFLCLLLFLLGSVHAANQTIDDVSRLHPTQVNAVEQYHELEGLQQALAQAQEEGLKVSIAGKRHSMGGHTFYPGALVLDMTSFNKVLAVDSESKTITVQSGATWADVMEAINPYNLSVEVMQAYNTFTIGGSMSVNVHESDPHYGPLIDTVNSFRLLLANGTVVNVTRADPLFGLVIGGYGLFGIILDADLSLTDNLLYEKQEYLMDASDYLAFFRKQKADPGIKMIFARSSIAPGATLLQETVVTTYRTARAQDPDLTQLDKPGSAHLKKFFFDLSRRYDWGKRLRWWMQKKFSNSFEAKTISRNNLMNADLRFLSYTHPNKTDILQEYFVPVEKLPSFLNDLRGIVQENDLNLLSATIRYLPPNEESVLSYSRQESFGVVLYFNVGTSQQEQEQQGIWTRRLIDSALDKNGSYYLPYQLYATQEQIREAYPKLDFFFAQKRRYDPQELFVNTFYATYAQQH